jgi:hypothetical protein
LGNNQMETIARINKAITTAKTDMVKNFMVQK